MGKLVSLCKYREMKKLKEAFDEYVQSPPFKHLDRMDRWKESKTTLLEDIEAGRKMLEGPLLEDEKEAIPPALIDIFVERPSEISKCTILFDLDASTTKKEDE